MTATLAALIDPIGVETFARDYWEKKPLLVRRESAGHFDGLLTLDDMDDILATSSPHESQVQVVTGGRKAALATLAASRPGGIGQALEVLYDHYRNGSTITLMFLHQRWAPLARLCRSMSAQLSANVQANVYLTPPGAQGFDTHYDTHDVFIAQIHGVKHWRLYPSGRELPLESEHWTMPSDGPGEPFLELDLRAGDLLYLPRGTVHDATSGDTASLHLTIGATHVTWAAMLHEAVDLAASLDSRYRAALPIGFAADPAMITQAESRLAELAGDVAGFVSAGPAGSAGSAGAGGSAGTAAGGGSAGSAAGGGSAVGAAARTVTARNQPELRGHLLDLDAMPSLDVDTTVRRRADMPWSLTVGGPVAELRFHGKAITMPGRVAAELRAAADGAEFTGRDLPGDLDRAGRITLIKTLLREGFLTMAQPAAPRP